MFRFSCNFLFYCLLPHIFTAKKKKKMKWFSSIGRFLISYGMIRNIGIFSSLETNQHGILLLHKHIRTFIRFSTFLVSNSSCCFAVFEMELPPFSLLDHLKKLFSHIDNHLKSGRNKMNLTRPRWQDSTESAKSVQSCIWFI